MAVIRTFNTGATRDQDTSKIDPEGFFSPLVMERRCQFMHKNRVMRDGNLRDSDNWQKGIPLEVYMKSAWRHFKDLWTGHRGHAIQDSLEGAICALMFNLEGYLHELLKAKFTPPATTGLFGPDAGMSTSIPRTAGSFGYYGTTEGTRIRPTDAHVPCSEDIPETVTGSDQYRELDLGSAPKPGRFTFHSRKVN